MKLGCSCISDFYMESSLPPSPLPRGVGYCLASVPPLYYKSLTRLRNTALQWELETPRG